MKLHNGLDAQRLLKMLGNALIKEQEQWKPAQYKSQIGAAVRHIAILYGTVLNAC